MSDFQNQDNLEPDFRTEPGIWLQKLVLGAWEMIWKTAAMIISVVVLIYVMGHLLIWFRGENVKEQEEAYYRERTVVDFTGSTLQPQLVTDDGNFVKIAYAGESEPLMEARFSVTLTLRNGKEIKIDQYRAAWKPNQEILLEVPSSEPVEKLILVGSAKLKGEDKMLYNEMLFVPESEDGPNTGAPETEQ